MKPTYGTFVKPRFSEIEDWVRLGATDKEVARRLGIGETTLRNYRKRHPEFDEHMRKAKLPADELVVNALYRLATGYYAETMKAYKVHRVYYDSEGRRCEDEEIKTVMLKDYVKPEVPAQVFWLNNRLPELFRRNAGKERLDERRFDLAKKQAEDGQWDDEGISDVCGPQGLL